MKKLVTIIIPTLLIALVVSCASLSPAEVSNTLPNLTTSKYLTQAQANEAIENGKCKYVVKGRQYAAPVGFTPKDDLKNAARGIDEWVQLDGANAYVLTNFRWNNISNDGSTQLTVDFDTFLCQ